MLGSLGEVGSLEDAVSPSDACDAKVERTVDVVPVVACHGVNVKALASSASL